MATRAKWYTDEHTSTWERIKAAFRNDWEQTRHDFGSERARDLDQDVDDTVKQMSGKQSTYRFGEMDFNDMEPAFRYGYAARDHYGEQYPTWTPSLRDELRRDYEGDWERDEPLIQHSYNYDYRDRR